MSRILVAYTSYSGSTEDVARAVGEELARDGAQVDVKQFNQVDSLTDYSAVVIGAPMILGWHADAVKFIRKHRQALSRVPVACWVMAMSLTRTVDSGPGWPPLTLDENLAVAPAHQKWLSIKERYTAVPNYLRQVLNAAPEVKPVSVAFFKGKLEFYRLKLLPMLFTLLVIQARPGDGRNWTAIRAWANEVAPLLKGG